MVQSKDMGDYELVRMEIKCRHCNRSFKGLHGLRIHLAFARKNAGSFQEIRQIDDEIVRVKSRYREILESSKDSQKSTLVVLTSISASFEPEGELEKNELAKEIVKIFGEHAKAENKEEIEHIVTLEKVLRLLPPGKSRIKTVYSHS
jgi:hypothetical protein